MTTAPVQEFDEEEQDRGSRRGHTNDNPSADLVRVYLNGIGKTDLLTADDEIELAQQIEVGLYAQHLLNDPEQHLTRAKKRDPKVLAKKGALPSIGSQPASSCFLGKAVHRSRNATFGSHPRRQPRANSRHGEI